MKKLIFIATVLVLSGCSLSETVASRDVHLPADATEITEMGNGWFTFKFKGHKYLYRAIDGTTYGGYKSRTEALTLMPDEAIPVAPLPR